MPCYNYNNNIHICIAPYGRNFRGASSDQNLSKRRLRLRVLTVAAETTYNNQTRTHQEMRQRT